MAIAYLPAGLAGIALWAFPLPTPGGDAQGLVFDAHRRTAVARSEWRVRTVLAQTRDRPDHRGDYARALLDLGQLRAFCGDFRAAHRHLTEAVGHFAEFDPRGQGMQSSAENLAHLSESIGHFAESERYHTIAWQLGAQPGGADPRRRAKRLSALGGLYASAGRMDLAERAARSAITMEPAAGRFADEIARDYGTLARVFIQAGRLKDAGRALDEADRLGPVGQTGFDLLRARVMIANGNDRDAGQVLRAVLDDPPTRHPWNRRLLMAVRVVLAGVVTREGDADRGQLILLTAISYYARTVGPSGPDYVHAVAEYQRLYPNDRASVAEDIAAIRASTRPGNLRGQDAVLGERP